MTTPTTDAAAAVDQDRMVTTIVAVGLTIGWVLGLAGTAFASGSTAQSTAWVVSSIGLVTATGLLAVRFAHTDVVMAAGVLVFAIGEVVIHAQGPGAIDAFAAATFAYVPALALTALASWPPLWARIAAAGSAVAFGAHAVSYLAGNAPGPEGTAAGIGYGLLTITLIGWSIRLLRGDARAQA